MSVAGIDQRLGELDKEFQALFAESQDGGFMKHADEFRRITEEMGRLKEQRAGLLNQQNSDSAAGRLIKNAVGILNAGSGRFDEWDESLIRQLVDTVKVLSKDRIRVYLRGGMKVEQELENQGN